MSPVGAKLAFEVLLFTATPGSPDVAVLQLEGRFRAPGRRRLGAPRLLAENAEERVEVGAADGGDAVADPDGAHWRASFAVPLRVLAGATFALAVGRELLDLPAPDRDESANGASDLHVRLAREANALRALADEAREAAAAALGRADNERGQRERLEAEMRGERHAREELATRLSQFETELTARDEALEAVRRGHEEALAEREAAVRAERDERVATVEAETAELRRALKNARAEIELLRRERDRAVVQRTEPATTRMVAEPSTHPEQEAAAPALPLPEGEEIGPVRPAAANGDGPAHDAADDDRDDRDDRDDDVVPPPTTVAGGRVDPAAVEDESDAVDEDEDDDDDDDEGTWSETDESEGVRVLGRRRRRARKDDAPPVEPLPGTAAIGARHIVPGDMGRGGLGPWIARGLAILALACVVAAVLVVVYGMR
ncbi:MAG: hypothetical protein QOH72_2912 [Solirubrobacteraceae bacterium]|nr:hypothetical protein [Solirubrobacteraceae bacterium]